MYLPLRHACGLNRSRAIGSPAPSLTVTCFRAVGDLRLQALSSLRVFSLTGYCRSQDQHSPLCSRTERFGQDIALHEFDLAVQRHSIIAIRAYSVTLLCGQAADVRLRVAWLNLTGSVCLRVLLCVQWSLPCVLRVPAGLRLRAQAYW